MKKCCLLIMVLMFAIAAVAQERKYDVKSGIMKTVTNVMGQNVDAVLYFDDYGNLECSLTKTFSGGEQIEISTISRNGTMYIVNHFYKQTQEIPIQESINYLNLTPEIIEKYNIQELGREKVLGKDCVKYFSETAQLGQKSSVIVWVWHGIPLKSITSSNGLEITMEVLETQFNVEIDQKVFEIPSF